MKLLLDTHTLLWFVLGNEKISSMARTLIEDWQNDTLIRPASYWEITIKISMGKYTLPVTYEHFIEEAIRGNGFRILPILPKHTAS